jgi:hypothetical protein
LGLGNESVLVKYLRRTFAAVRCIEFSQMTGRFDFVVHWVPVVDWMLSEEVVFYS